MNDTSTREPDRTDALRNALVATVNASPYASRRFQPRLIGAAIGVFALAGALTGGAISATALASATYPSVTVDVEAVTAQMASDLVGTHTELFGTPFILSGQSKTIIRMGTRPPGATSIAVTIRCLDVGTHTVSFNGDYFFGLSCTREATDHDRSSFGGGGSHYDVHGNDPQTLTVDPGGSNRYVLWASWAATTPIPPASAAQLAELADGHVTRAEYDAAFDRFASCMAAAGHPVDVSNRGDTIIRYTTSGAAAHAGVDAQCYSAEFEQVDSAWQQAHQG